MNYITEEQYNNAIRLLDNAQDKFIVTTLYKGYGGKEAEDLLSLKAKDVDLKNKKIQFKSRLVTMDEDYFKITKDAIEQEKYYRLGEDTNFDFYLLNINSEYVLKVMPTVKNKNGILPMAYGGLRSRLYALSGVTGVDLRPNVLETSGFINEILKIKKDWTTYELILEIAKREIKLTAQRVYKMIKEINSSNN